MKMHQFSSLNDTNMSLNGYTVEIVTINGTVGSKTINGAHYIPLDDRTEYKLRISSNKGLRTDATVWIDGNKVGVWRIKPYGSITVERPVNNARKFTFLKEGSRSAVQGGIKTGKEENGIIKVVFKHERQQVFYDSLGMDGDSFMATNSMSYGTKERKFSRLSNDSMNMLQSDYSAGGTALGDHSSQSFRECEPLYDIDHGDITTIIARLVCDDRNEFVPLGYNRSSTKYPIRL